MDLSYFSYDYNPAIMGYTVTDKLYNASQDFTFNTANESWWLSSEGDWFSEAEIDYLCQALAETKRVKRIGYALAKIYKKAELLAALEDWRKEYGNVSELLILTLAGME